MTRLLSQRWCWPCMAALTLLLTALTLWSVNAQAAGLIPAVDTGAFSARDLILALASIVSALATAFIAGLRTRQDKLEDKHADLRELVIGSYATKADLREAVGSIERTFDKGVAKLERQLERLLPEED